MEIAVLALAAWRITFMLANEDVFGWLRHLLGVREDPESKRYGKNWLARQILCPWCTSLFFGSLFAIGYLVWPRETFAIALPFAISAGAILVHTSRPIQRWLE